VEPARSTPAARRAPARTAARPSRWLEHPRRLAAMVVLLGCGTVAIGLVLLRKPPSATQPSTRPGQPARPTDSTVPRAVQPDVMLPKAEEVGSKDARLVAPARPAPPRPVAPGSLSVQSKSRQDGRYLWADVYLDGKGVGQTMLTLTALRAGRHRLEVSRRGYRSIVQHVTIQPNQRTRVLLELEPVAQ
jgi:hypothetical protein